MIWDVVQNDVPALEDRRPPARRRVPEPALTLDPITLAVIENGLVQVCNEMDLAFSRAAFSPVIAEANDRSDGIYASAPAS